MISLEIVNCQCERVDGSSETCKAYVLTITGPYNNEQSVYVGDGCVDENNSPIPVGCYRILGSYEPTFSLPTSENYILHSTCDECHAPINNKKITLRNCQTQNEIIFIVDSNSPIVQTFTDLIGKIVTIRNCVGCFEVISVEDTQGNITTEPYLLKQYDRCSDCVKTYLVPQYEKQGYNYRNEYYPELNYKCDINIIDDIISRFTKWVNIKAIQKNLKILTNKIKEFDRRLFESKIKYLTLKYNIEDEYSCCINKGTCCPPCILEWKEIVYNICNLITELSVDITPTRCNQIRNLQVDLLNCQQITLVSPGFQFGRCHQVRDLVVELL